MTRPDSRQRMLSEGYGLRGATKMEALQILNGPQDYEPVSWSVGLDAYVAKPANFQFFRISDEEPPRVIAYINDPRGPKGGPKNPFVEYEPVRTARTESLVQEHDWRWNLRAGDGNVEFVAYDSSSGNVAIWKMAKGPPVRTEGDPDCPFPPVDIIKRGKQILGEALSPQAFADRLMEDNEMPAMKPAEAIPAEVLRNAKRMGKQDQSWWRPQEIPAQGVPIVTTATGRVKAGTKGWIISGTEREVFLGPDDAMQAHKLPEFTLLFPSGMVMLGQYGRDFVF